MAAGIPVVIIDSGLDSGPYSSFVATDNHQGRVTAAHHLAELLDGQGKVILLRYAVGSASTEDRKRGFLTALAADYPDSSDPCGSDLPIANKSGGRLRSSGDVRDQEIAPTRADPSRRGIT